MMKLMLYTKNLNLISISEKSDKLLSLMKKMRCLENSGSEIDLTSKKRAVMLLFFAIQIFSFL